MRLLLLALAACRGEEAAPRAGFPPDFLWGAATAGFQVEPGCPTLDPEICEDRASDWYQWVTDPDLVADPTTYLSGEPVSHGPGFRELWEGDLDRLAGELGGNALRVSIEWSRLFPDGAAEAAASVEELAALADPVEVAWLHDLFAGMRARGIEPLVTLDHYTLPLWLHDGKACHADLDGCTDRGWVDGERIVPAISLYAAWCAREFGAEVDWWLTLNEPWAVILAGYIAPTEDRTNPPGVLLALDEAMAVLWNMVEAHARMYDAVHAEDAWDASGDGVAARVGLVPNLAAIAPADPDDPLDVAGAANADALYNRLMLDATVRGEVDRDLDGVAEETDPELAGRMDYIGVNYYTRLTVAGLPGPLDPDIPLLTFVPDGSIWEVYPEGLREVLELAGSYGLPVVVTENGTTDPEGEDGDAFLVRHLLAAREALAAGVDLRGYLWWSLVDNYEWNHGMSMDFGLWAVDPEDPARERTPRSIVDTYAAIVAAGDVPAELEAAWGR